MSVRWRRACVAVLLAAVALMAVAAARRLGNEFARLVWDPTMDAAPDLTFLHAFVRAWFDGKLVYAESADAIHPPATYALLWPFLGWLDLWPARWLWAATVVPVLGWLVFLVVRESGAEGFPERAFAALLLLSMGATGQTIGHGQLGIHVVALLLTAVLLLYRRPPSAAADVAVAALFLLALVKPNLSAPFFWLVLFAPSRPRPAVLVVAGYAALTLLAAAFQDASLGELVRWWLARSGAHGAEKGSDNVHLWLGALGLGRWAFAASILLLGALGAWTYRQRRADIWPTLGVAAVVARLWTYHWFYDDVVLALPMVALFRIAKSDRAEVWERAAAGALLGLTLLGLIALHSLRHFGAVAPVVWVAVLLFLAYEGWKESRAGVPEVNGALEAA